MPGDLLRLRILETTDVHAKMMPFDYYTNRDNAAFGLARTATLIHEAREEVENCLLFDNGDFLQGCPISDITAQPGSGWTGNHPVIEVMNHLCYDAAGLGNHDFNFGLNWLAATLRPARFPVLCANITRTDRSPRISRPYAILDRDFIDADGRAQRLRIGVIGLLPPQITIWDKHHLQGRLTSHDMIDTARDYIPRMRAEGADIILALAHTGISANGDDEQENAALPLAKTGAIDVLLLGHSHDIFPAGPYRDRPHVDTGNATLHGVPAMLPGSHGTCLGVMDLCLHRNRAGKWQILDHHIEIRHIKAAPHQPVIPADPAITALLAPIHRKTLHLTGQPIGYTRTPLHSYLALVRNDPATQLVLMAQKAVLKTRLRGSDHADLPILSASASFKTGGHGGPENFTDIPAGRLYLRNTADLYIFPNSLCGLLLTGASLRDWLERAAICFNHIIPDQGDQPLLNPDIPPHNFDVISGLTYMIDPSVPPRFDLSGRLIDPKRQRIRNLRHAGRPVTDAQQFVVATNNYRAFGGGPFLPLADDHLICQEDRPIREHIADYIARHTPLDGAAAQIWRFAPLNGTGVLFETGPAIRHYPEALQEIGATGAGTAASGFARYRIVL